MITKESFEKEQIFREVTSVGNGAHVFAPKEWIGEKVLIIKPYFSLKERILKVIEPYLENITGVYIYGSYSRGEQREDSDIDLLVISNKNIKINKEGFEIIILKEDNISEAIKIAPVLIYSILLEAKPIINSELLENLRKNYKPKLQDFKDYIKETRNIIKINKEILDPYSIVLRLRGVYLIEKILSGKKYSYEEFRGWINYKKLDFDKIYKSYLMIKKNLKTEIEENNLKELLLILENKIQILEERIYGKKKKEA